MLTNSLLTDITELCTGQNFYRSSIFGDLRV